MQDGNDSCRIFRSGLMLSHLEPRISTMTVKPCLHTSSLGWRWGGGVQRAWEESKDEGREGDGGSGCDRERKGETAGVGKDERDGERRGRGHEMVQKRKRK